MAFKTLRRSVRDFREDKKSSGLAWPEHLFVSSIAWVFTSQYGREQRMSQYFYGC